MLLKKGIHQATRRKHAGKIVRCDILPGLSGEGITPRNRTTAKLTDSGVYQLPQTGLSPRRDLGRSTYRKLIQRIT